MSTTKPTFTDRELELARLVWRCFSVEPKVDNTKLAEVATFKNAATASACWGPVKRKLMSEKTVKFTARELELASLIWQCFSVEPKVDMDKLAVAAGFKNASTASACWGPVKRKLLQNAATGVAGKRKKNGDDASEAPAPPAPKRKRPSKISTKPKVEKEEKEEPNHFKVEKELTGVKAEETAKPSFEDAFSAEINAGSIDEGTGIHNHQEKSQPGMFQEGFRFTEVEVDDDFDKMIADQIKGESYDRAWLQSSDDDDFSPGEI